MEEKLIAFIEHEFLSDQNSKITLDTKLISSGLIDSFSLVSLLAFINKEFGKAIPAPKVTPESFDTIREMIKLINNL
jgi:acyl carrier protein